MFQELRSMRRKLTLYYALVLVLFTSIITSFVLYNVFYANGFMLDRELKVNSAQVNDLRTIPELKDMGPKPDKGHIPDEGKNADAIFKFFLRDKKMEIIQSSIHYPALFDQSRVLARKSWSNQQERWDTIHVDGVEYRFFTIPFHKSGENGIVQTYCNLTMLQQFGSRFIYLLIAVALGVILLAALVGWWLAGRAMDPVKLAWKRQKEFIADVSHELRTPLTIIQSNLDVAIADENGSVHDNMIWLQNAYSSTASMGKLVNDLLLLARIDAKDIRFEPSDFDLSCLLIELSSQFAPIFQAKNINFSLDIEDQVRMYGDPVRMRQTVSIFLDNATQYTLDGGSVSLGMKKAAHFIEIVIADSGIGFADSEKDKIFNRFYRVDKARSRKQGGTGLGLAIAAWIIEQHKGRIEVSSKDGEGSTFRVLLPLS